MNSRERTGPGSRRRNRVTTCGKCAPMNSRERTGPGSRRRDRVVTCQERIDFAPGDVGPGD
eukprot:14824238-Alexandrium_andersonii.AAC.1